MNIMKADALLLQMASDPAISLAHRLTPGHHSFRLCRSLLHSFTVCSEVLRGKAQCHHSCAQTARQRCARCAELLPNKRPDFQHTSKVAEGHAAAEDAAAGSIVGDDAATGLAAVEHTAVGPPCLRLSNL